MNAPDKIWADWDSMYPEQNGGYWWGEQCAGTEYTRADLHQSALADRDATIARMQAELVAKDDAWIADQTGNADEIIRLGDKLERLQARLDAGPSVTDMAVCKGLALSLKAPKVADSIQNIIERMEAANGK